MEEIIRKIISIDKDTENYKKENEKVLENKKKLLEDEIQRIRDENEFEINGAKKEIIENKIAEAEALSKKIIEDRGKEENHINEVYENIKDKIIDEALKEILKVK